VLDPCISIMPKVIVYVTAYINNMKLVNFDAYTCKIH